MADPGTIHPPVVKGYGELWNPQLQIGWRYPQAMNDAFPPDLILGFSSATWSAIAAVVSMLVVCLMVLVTWRDSRASSPNLGLDMKIAAYDLYGQISSWAPGRREFPLEIPDGSLECVLVIITNSGRMAVSVEAPQLELLKSRMTPAYWRTRASGHLRIGSTIVLAHPSCEEVPTIRIDAFGKCQYLLFVEPFLSSRTITRSPVLEYDQVRVRVAIAGQRDLVQKKPMGINPRIESLLPKPDDAVRAFLVNFYLRAWILNETKMTIGTSHPEKAGTFAQRTLKLLESTSPITLDDLLTVASDCGMRAPRFDPVSQMSLLLERLRREGFVGSPFVETE